MALKSVSLVDMGRNVLYKRQDGCTDLKTGSKYAPVFNILPFSLIMEIFRCKYYKRSLRSHKSGGIFCS